MSALDLGARQLAVQARSEGVRSALLAKIARGITRGRMARLTTAPPIIGAPGNASAITPGTLYDAPANQARFTFLRARWEPGTGYPNDLIMIPEAVGIEPGPLRNGGTSPLVRFWSDATVLEIINRAGGGGYRLRVDGEYVAAGFIAKAAGNPQADFYIYTQFDWSGVRAMRLYEVECESNTAFGGVRVPPTSIVWAAPLGDDDLRVVVHGDSFVEGSGASMGALHGPLVACLPQLLGQPDTRGTGLGGTGFLNTLGGTRARFIDRVQSDVIAPGPQIVIELGGANDRDLVQTNAGVMQAAVTAWLDRVQAALPRALIFMTGPMSPIEFLNTDPASIAVRDGKKAACSGRRNTVFIDNLAEAWITGDGRAAAPSGTGIADWATAGDGAHPSDAGHRYLAERIVRGIAAGLGTA